MASQVFQHPVQTMRSFCARSVGVVDGGDEEGDGDDASPCLTSLSLMLSTLPPLPSSWQKEGRILAFLSTNLIDHVNTVDGGGGVAENMALLQCQPCQLPGKPGMLQLLHWSVPSLLALGGDGGGVGDSSLLQSGLVQK